MADKKTKDESEVLYPALLAKHILRGASDDASGNFFIYFSKLIAGIVGYKEYTVAEAQAAAIAFEFIPGQRIKITDPYGADTDNEFRTVAKSTSELETRGHGIYQNSVMITYREFEMGYTLADDHIYYLYDQKFNNECRQVGITMIDNIPFDTYDAGRGTPGDLLSANIKHNYFENVTLTLSDTTTQIQNSRIINSALTTSTTSGSYGCLIWDCYFFNATVSMIARNVGGIFLPGWGDVLIGSLCQDLEVSNQANHTNDGAEIHGKITGAGITLDTTNITAIAPGYIGYGIYNFQGSTFGVTGYQVPAINPDGGGNSDFTACPWAGSAMITDTGTSGGNFNQILNHSGVKLRIFLENGIGTPLAFADGAGNIKTPGATTVTLTPGKGDWLDMQAKLLDPSFRTIMDYANYT